MVQRRILALRDGCPGHDHDRTPLSLSLCVALSEPFGTVILRLAKHLNRDNHLRTGSPLNKTRSGVGT